MADPERRQAELVRARLAAIVESSDDAIIGKTLEGIITNWNAGAERLYGYTADEVIGRPISLLIPPDRPDELPSILARIRRRERISHFETERVAKDGRRLSVSLSISPITDAAGALTGAATIARDITERKRSEQERAHLAAIVESSDDAILSETLDGIITSWNQGAERLYGYRADEVLERPRSIIIPPDRQGEFPAMLERLRRGERIEHHETVRVRKDGARIDVSVSMAPLRDAAGRIVGASGIGRDITDRVRSEQRLRFLAESGAHLAASLDVEETLAAVTRLATGTVADHAVVWLADDAGDLRAAATAHRDPAKEPLAAELARRYPPRAGDRSQLRQAIETGRAMLVPTVTDEHYARAARDAEYLRLLRELGFASALYVPLLARGRTLGAIGLFTDQTRRRFGEEDLAIAEEVARRAALALDNARLYREAQDAIRARDEFLSIASHELRTPVASISGVAQLLQRARRRGRLDEGRLERALDQIARGSERLASLTEDLLDVSRLQTGHFDLRLEPIDVAAFVCDLVDHHREHLDERHTLVFEAGEGACAVRADPARLEQVVANLLGNAVKYSPEGGPIEVAVARDGAGVRLEVRDRGIGLPAGATAALFHPFGRADNAAELQIPGLGLGLYICRQIVERHGGRVWAASPGEGLGTTLGVWLPCAEPGERDG